MREGDANATEIRLDKARINIGRAVDVLRSEGLHRRNDLAFAAETEINRTVSREHAHISFDQASGEYRLFNDRWYALGGHDCGTWIVRDGMSLEVHRNTRGTKLEPGDEIHFGLAVVVFQFDAAPEAHVVKIRRTDVSGLRPDQPAVAKLLQAMRGPAEDAARRRRSE